MAHSDMKETQPCIIRGACNRLSALMGSFRSSFVFVTLNLKPKTLRCGASGLGDFSVKPKAKGLTLAQNKKEKPRACPRFRVLLGSIVQWVRSAIDRGIMHGKEVGEAQAPLIGYRTSWSNTPATWKSAWLDLENGLPEATAYFFLEGS